MRLKKIWLGAFTFGLIATAILYFTIFAQAKQSAHVSSTVDNKNKTTMEQTTNVQGNKDAAPSNGSKIMLQVGKGKRAFSLQLSNDAQGVSGFIEPGSYVDVSTLMPAPKDKPDQHDAATLLLQNIKVLAVGHAADTKQEASRYKIITLEVTPDEGLELELASKNQFYLMLRNDKDTSTEPDKTNLHEDVLQKGVFN